MKKVDDTSILVHCNTPYSSIHVSAWDNDCVWLNLQVENGGVHTVLSRENAQELMSALQHILSQTPDLV